MRYPIFYEFVHYFLHWSPFLEEQGTDTSLSLNDYFYDRGEITQKIVIKMLFKINMTPFEIWEKAEHYKKIIKIGNSHLSVFEAIMKDLEPAS
jgi:hypothetical protein